ncbi:hypothetical protein C0075_26215 [Rhizobium sp. KAs_5_22]|nr:hypothetical protein C0075_26215 [Rhizobium sp. KAs_5_22]
MFEAYELLGIDPNINISVPQIKALRRKMAKQHHPDKNLQVNTNERMTEINNACDFLIEHKQNEKNKE